MKERRQVLLCGALIATSENVQQGALLIEGERIKKIWLTDEQGMTDLDGSAVDLKTLAEKIHECAPETDIMNLEGKVLMAGGIDAHVHFREPGMTSKADMASESRAALLGGVTSFIDMPNTVPATTSIGRLREKVALAEGRCFANWGFHIGADNDNPDTIAALARADAQREFAAVKVFMGSSTGNMLVDNGEALDKLFTIDQARVLIHSEDEAIIRKNLEEAINKFGDDIPMKEHENIRSRQACIRSTIKALQLAMKHGTKLHVLHISTAEEVEMIRAAKQYNPEITAETSANYLWFRDEDYERLGSRMKCNPSIKTAADRAALRRALKDGIIDTIGSDHAPHLAEEKERPYLKCPSGIPSIQQEISVLLTVADKESIPLTRIASVISEKIADMLGICGRGRLEEGAFADVIVIDPKKEFTVGESDYGAAGAAYKCGWTPYAGARLKGMVEDVYLNGVRVVQNGRMTDGKALGQKLLFR
mgnify:CR=1 FL=1